MRILLEIVRAGGKGEAAVGLPDEAGMANAVDGPHQIPDILRVVDDKSLQSGRRTPLRLPGALGNEAAEILGKEKVLLEKQHIRFDVEEAKGDGAVIYRLKCQRQAVSSFSVWSNP